jgi:hypothetical protein
MSGRPGGLTTGGTRDAATTAWATTDWTRRAATSAVAEPLGTGAAGRAGGETT